MRRSDYLVMSGVECTARSVRGSYLTHACDRWRVTRATVGVAPPARARINSVGCGGRGGAVLACTPTAAAHGACRCRWPPPRRAGRRDREAWLFQDIRPTDSTSSPHAIPRLMHSTVHFEVLHLLSADCWLFFLLQKVLHLDN